MRTGRDTITDFVDGADSFVVVTTLSNPDGNGVAFQPKTFLDFDSNSDGVLDAADDDADVRNVTLDGEEAASLILDIGAAYGLRNQTITFYGVTAIDGFAGIA